MRVSGSKPPSSPPSPPIFSSGYFFRYDKFLFSIPVLEWAELFQVLSEHFLIVPVTVITKCLGHLKPEKAKVNSVCVGHSHCYLRGVLAATAPVLKALSGKEQRARVKHRSPGG